VRVLKNAVWLNFIVRAKKLIIEIFNKCLSKIPLKGGAVTFSALSPTAGSATYT